MVTESHNLPSPVKISKRRTSLFMLLGITQILIFILMIFGVVIKLTSLNPMVRKIAEQDSNPLLMVNLPWFYIGVLFIVAGVNGYILKTKFKDIMVEEWPADDDSWALHQ